MNIFKKISLCVAAIISMVVTVHAEGVGIADTEITPDASAMFEVASTNKGALFPRMTTAQREAIPTPAVGLLVYDTDVDGFFYRTIADWELIGTSSSPVGSVTAFAGTTNSIPNGWLLCDGSAVNSSNYPALYVAIGIAWGDGANGSGTDFNLPDMRGYFLRGVSHNTTRDPDRNARTSNGYGNKVQVGSSQPDAIRNITGSFNGGPTYSTPNADGAFAETTFASATHVGGSDRTTGHTDVTLSAARVVPTGGDNRPKNVYVNYIIKY